MAKINVLQIVLAHFRSILDGGLWRGFFDLLIFIGVPALCAYLFYRSVGNISSEIRELFVTVFSIFSALLFSAQIGLFALRRSDGYESLNDIERSARQKKDNDFNEFLRNFSANTSYLIIVSAFSLLLFVVEFLLDPHGNGAGLHLVLDCSLIFLAAHFFLTLLMVLKRFFVSYEASY